MKAQYFKVISKSIMAAQKSKKKIVGRNCFHFGKSTNLKPN